MPKGRWIASDYFRIGDTLERRSGHRWERFLQKLEGGGWKITHEQQITKNVLPTLAYLDMWGRKAGFPFFRFSVEKFQRKHPAVHFLLEDVVEDLTTYISAHLELVSNEISAREKKYMLLVIEKG